MQLRMSVISIVLLVYLFLIQQISSQNESTIDNRAETSETTESITDGTSTIDDGSNDWTTKQSDNISTTEQSISEQTDTAETGIENTTSSDAYETLPTSLDPINSSKNDSYNEDDTKYVKISFVTNNPKSTTRNDKSSTSFDEDSVFKFWSTLSEASANRHTETDFKPPENGSSAINKSPTKVNMVKDNKPIVGHLITVAPDRKNYNAKRPIDIDEIKNYEGVENLGKIGDDIELDESVMGKTLSEDQRNVMEAVEYGLQKMKELYDVQEPKLYNMGLWLEADNPARFLATFNWQSEEARKYAKYGYASLQASAHLKKKYDDAESRITGTEKNPPKLSTVKKSALRQQCPLRGVPRCPPASKRYRTHDGTCNNPRRGRWGSSLTPVERFLPPYYEDEVSEARGSDSALPSPRLVSSRVHSGHRRDATAVSHMLMQWGQFLDHDITSSSQARAFNGSVPRCCLDAGRHFVPSQFMHPDCMPIDIPEDDEFYGPLGIRCMEFVRSSPAPRIDCEFGWREQMNQVTAYIDASPIYSSSARQSDKLRLFRNGLLQYGRAQARRPVLPPREDDEEALCQGGAVDASCFKSGDGRVNEHPGLVAMHIVWLRKHNRLATELAHLNPHWSDEKIYQETRKIVGAFIQHITYNEFLPIVLGSEVTRLFDLDLLKKGYFKGYNSKVNPSPANAFGAAAFRFGHSLVQDSFMRYDRFHRPLQNNVSLHDELSNPSNIWSFGAVDRLVLGMCNQPSQKRDEFITPELTNHLFQTSRFGFGLDLAAINVQRGRDHGLPPYVDWREPCGLTSIREWSDLYAIMPSNTVENLQDVYRRVDDIDLFTGGMAEKPVIGGLVGPTFACIIAQQFSNLKRGDRFWYENGGFESSFTPAQLQQIRKVTLAQILCQTLENIDTIQPFVFIKAEEPKNERISCLSKALNNFDLTPWTERTFDFTNDINELDRTNFVKSTSTKPHSTHDFGRLTLSTRPDTKLTDLPNIDDKLDLPTRQKNISKPTLHNSSKVKMTTKHTTASSVKLDEKLDFSDIAHKIEHKTVNDDISTTQNRSLNLKKDNDGNLSKTYDFLLNAESQLPFFSNLFSRITTTTPKPTTQKPHISYYQTSPYSTAPNAYLINIVPKTTPKYQSNYPIQQTIKITVQAPSASKPKPQNNPFPYDKRPVYQNNKLEYRPLNTYNNISNNQYPYNAYAKPSVMYNLNKKPQVHINNYNDNQVFSESSVYSLHSTSRPININSLSTTSNYDRPYRPYRPVTNSPSFTTEYNPYSLVTFHNVETTKRYDFTQNAYINQNVHFNSQSNKKPSINSNPYSVQVTAQTSSPTNNSFTIYIQNKPVKIKPQNDLSYSNTENTFTDNDETLPLFVRPNYHRPFLDKPSMINIRPDNLRPDPIDYIYNKNPTKNTYNVPLESEHGFFAENSNVNNYNWNKIVTNNNPYKVSSGSVNINLASEFGSQHQSDISIVIDPNLKSKLKINTTPDYYSTMKHQTTTKSPSKYYYIRNVLHKYPETKNGDEPLIEIPLSSKMNDKIVKENYNNMWKPNNEEKKLYDDPSDFYEDDYSDDEDETIIGRKTAFKAVFTQPKNNNNDKVSFDVIPSENSPTMWTVYEEKLEDNTYEHLYTAMPSIVSESQASKELPRPINLSGIIKYTQQKKISKTR